MSYTIYSNVCVPRLIQILNVSGSSEQCCTNVSNKLVDTHLVRTVYPVYTYAVNVNKVNGIQFAVKVLKILVKKKCRLVRENERVSFPGISNMLQINLKSFLLCD